jgi:hypothetical protein
MAQESITFRDLTGLAKWLKIALGILVVATLLNGLSSLLQIGLLEEVQRGVRIAKGAAAANESREALTGSVYLIAYIATAILFLRWTYLTKKNTTALGASGLAFSPGWSVGYYFVPVLTLWKPYQALKETFQASHPEFRENWKGAPRPGLLPLWWAIWLINCFLDQAIFRASIGAHTITELIAASGMNLLSTLIDLPLVAVVWVLVSTLQRWQTAKFELVGHAVTQRHAHIPIEIRAGAGDSAPP